MQDVARKAGVHVGTVSRALGGCPGVSEEVRKKIQEFATKLGYRPNPLVSALIKSRRNPNRDKYRATLALLLPDWPPGSVSYVKDYQAMLRGVHTRAAELGYVVDEIELAGLSRARSRLDSILQARNVVGVIIPPLYDSCDAVPLDISRFPTVAIGLSQRMPVHRVVHDHARAVRVAMQKCRAVGCKRIGLVLSRRVSEKVEHRWLAAYLLEKFLSVRGRGVIPPLIMDEPFKESDFGEWFGKHRPDCLLGLPHFMPLRKWIQNLPASVSAGVRLVSLDLQDGGRHYAGIDQVRGELGARAIDHLASLIERNAIRPPGSEVTISVEGNWVDGPSLEAP
jgi:LacI family transcriptional regulator